MASFTRPVVSRYRAEGATPVEIDFEEIERLGIRVRETRLLPKRMSVQVRHDPHRLARASAGWPDPLAVKPSIRPPAERRPAPSAVLPGQVLFARRPSERPSMSTSSRVVTTRSAPAAARMSASSARARPSAAKSPALAA